MAINIHNMGLAAQLLVTSLYWLAGGQYNVTFSKFTIQQWTIIYSYVLANITFDLLVSFTIVPVIYGACIPVNESLYIAAEACLPSEIIIVMSQLPFPVA